MTGGEELIIEGIVTTLGPRHEEGRNEDVNISPMGPLGTERMDTLLLKPYTSSRTYRNLKRHGEGLFDGIPNRFSAGRYHSLAVCEGDLPAELEISARTDDGLIMAMRHKMNKVWGIQFHPESVLTEHGHPLLEGFLRLAGIDALRPARETA